MKALYLLIVIVSAFMFWSCKVSSSDNKEARNDTISETIKLKDYQVYKQKLDLMKKELSDSCRKVIPNLSAIDYFNSKPYKLSDLDSITLEQFLDYRGEKTTPFNRFDYFVFDQLKSMENAGHCYISSVFSNEKYCGILVHLYWDCQNSCVLYSFNDKFNIMDKFHLFSFDCDPGEGKVIVYDLKECFYFKNDSLANHKRTLIIDDNGKIKEL